MSTLPAPHVLREYALLADGERGAVVGPRGDVAWLCFPGWADPAVLASLIGGRGAYVVTPAGRCVWGGHYEPGSLIWRSRWITETGVVECREALAFPGRRDRAVLLRRIVAVAGDARVDVTCAPAGDYGRAPARDVRRAEDGAWHMRLGDVPGRWDGAPEARPDEDGALHLDLELPAGAHHDLVLVLGDREPVDADAAWGATEAAWRERAEAMPDTIATRDARHARAVLRGLTSPGGGMVAAATMSLPERARSGRSYDYRFAWIRDQAMAGEAAARAGAWDLLDDAVRFITARLLDDGPQLAPAYTVSGEPMPGEQTLGLPGYPGAADVAGNHAGAQFQLDAFGEALLLLAAAAAHDRLDADALRAAEVAAGAIERRRHELDAGVWELEPAVWTHSRLICAAGLRAMAAVGGVGARGAPWLALADALVAEAAASCVHPSGRWQSAPQVPRVDAALLLCQLRGATAPDDPRAVATLAAVEAELCQDHYVYRFRPDGRPLGEAEGAFLLCGFVTALALHQRGRHLDAGRYFERNRGACGAPGLLAEEFDVEQRQLRGNLPQAFVHALLLECAATLRGSDEPPAVGRPQRGV